MILKRYGKITKELALVKTVIILRKPLRLSALFTALVHVLKKSTTRGWVGRENKVG